MIRVLSFSATGDHPANEDVFDATRHPADPDCWLCFLADGQGGRAGGERAARLACRTAADAAIRLSPAELATPHAWVNVLQEADLATAADREAGLTTLVGFCITDNAIAGASSGDSAVLAASTGGRTNALTDRQAKNPPVGSGAAWFVPFSQKMVIPWSVLAMSDGVWKYVGWDRIIATISAHHGQPLIEALQTAVRLRTGRFPDDFTVVVFEGVD
jgi:PPM family protein phosphatase